MAQRKKKKLFCHLDESIQKKSTSSFNTSTTCAKTKVRLCPNVCRGIRVFKNSKLPITDIFFLSICLDVPHLTNEHRTQDCIAR